MKLQEKTDGLKEKLNIMVADTELTNHNVVDISQQLDELIVLRYRQKYKKYY